MPIIMGIVNLTPDSFVPSSRVAGPLAIERIAEMRAQGADIIDIGAVSTRPGASQVDLEEEWRRLKPILAALPEQIKFSIDTTRAEIVRRSYDLTGAFIINDISAGEDDSQMLITAGALGLEYVAMHKRGNPHTMDSRCDYPNGVMPELCDYFSNFSIKAEAAGIKNWILDPGLGFAKTEEQNWEILQRLDELKHFGRPILIGAADKRFTHGDTEKANSLALSRGADILRVHNVPAAIRTLSESQQKIAIKNL